MAIIDQKLQADTSSEPIQASTHHDEHMNNLTELQIELDDPHRSALEFNPEHAQRLTLPTILAVVVSYRGSLA